MTKALNLSPAEIISRLCRIVDLPTGYAFDFGVTCSGTQAPCIHIRVDGFEFEGITYLYPFEEWLESDEDGKVLRFLARVEHHCKNLVEYHVKAYDKKTLKEEKNDDPDPDLPF